jgi:cytochrome P450
MTMTDQRLPVFDFQAMVAEDDPYPRYAEMRAFGPLVKATMPLTFAVTRHADVSALLRDHRIGHRFPRAYLDFALGDGPAADFQENSLLNRDGEDHSRLRSLMARAFRGLTVRKLHDHIVDLVDDLITPALDKGAFDVVADLAFPLPSQVICELLGIDNVDRDEVRTNAAALLGQDREATHASTTWMRDYISGVLAERSPDADGDLLERMLAAEEGDDAFTHQEIVDNAMLLFFAGFETTSNLIATGCNALLDHPDQQQVLWDDPSIAANAVEEFVRYDAPLPAVNRITLEEIEVGGRVIKPMRVLLLLLASANHDEDVFVEPARLDITRRPNPHLSFAGGVHHCIGAMLARVEGEVVFRRLAERFAAFERNGAAIRRYAQIRSFDSLPVIATPA